MENSTRRHYTLAVDFTDGRTPTYERHLRWLTTEENARRYFTTEAPRQSLGARCALIDPTGRVIATA